MLKLKKIISKLTLGCTSSSSVAPTSSTLDSQLCPQEKPPASRLTNLPAHLLPEIAAFLDVADVRSLRLAGCRALADQSLTGRLTLTINANNYSHLLRFNGDCPASTASEWLNRKAVKIEFSSRDPDLSAALSTIGRRHTKIFHSVTRLEIDWSGCVQPDSFEFLAHMPNLERLVFWGHPFHQEAQLASFLAGLTTRMELRVEGGKGTAAALLPCPTRSLKQLAIDMPRPSFTGHLGFPVRKAVDPLLRLAGLTALECLRLRFVNIRGGDLRHLRSMTGLRELLLDSCFDVVKHAHNPLAGIEKCAPNLETLLIDGCGALSKEALSSLAGLPSLSTLSLLRLDNFSKLRYLAEGGMIKALKELRITKKYDGNRESAWEELLPLRSIKSLECVQVYGQHSSQPKVYAGPSGIVTREMGHVQVWYIGHVQMKNANPLSPYSGFDL